MSSALPRIVILGAGPAGVGAARQLRYHQRAHVTVLEQHAGPGGNAGSFEFGGMRVDYGSHRLHPACNVDILADIRGMLGADLIDRPRHGRIRLRQRWIHFPLRPADLVLRLDKRFALGALRDMIGKPFRARASETSFADVLLTSLGPTICESFYFPYAWKMWGRAPSALSAIQARRRVSASSFSKLLRKVFPSVPSMRPPGAGRFYYPRQGFGQISEAYAADASARGAEFRYGRSVTRLQPPTDDAHPWIIETRAATGPERFEADYVWSTVPIALLAKLLGAHVPSAVTHASTAIESRAMILVYLLLPTPQFTEFDAHYFPGADVRITRLSEPKNYANTGVPSETTVLCAELPCSASDAVWSMSDTELGNIVEQDLARAGIPLRASPTAILCRRLPQAYPIYGIGYEHSFATLDAWVESLPRLLSFGRQGLFAHDNTHHALAMAYAATNCLGDTEFSGARWREYRAEFERHVVED